jgi:hypothetical protein
MKTLKGNISLSRTSSNVEEMHNKVHITLEDELSSAQVVSIWMELKEFAMMITGLSSITCTFEFNDGGVVGMKREYKIVEIEVPNDWYPRLNKDMALSKPWEVSDLLAPYEVDGWKARREDMFNHHNRVYTKDRTWYRVAFVRFVSTDGNTASPIAP